MERGQRVYLIAAPRDAAEAGSKRSGRANGGQSQIGAAEVVDPVTNLRVSAPAVE